MTPIPDRASIARRTSLLLSILVAMLGALVLVGWAMDIAMLKSVLPALTTMKANTALSLMLCGVALALLSWSKTPAKRGLVALLPATVVLILGLISLAEYLVGVDLGIDQLLIADPLASIGTTSPGRMSAVTAFCFVLAGFALVFAALPALRLRLAAISALAIALIVVAALSLVGYASEALLHVRSWSYTGMALHSACGLIVLGGALLASVRSEGGSAWAMGNGVTAGFAAAVAVMLMAAGIVYTSTNQLSESAARVSHTHQVFTLLEQVDSDMADLEDSQRGFIILGTEDLLSQRERNRSTLRDELARLRTLIADNASQQARLDRLEPLLSERTDVGDQSIAVRRRDGFAAAQQLLATRTDIALTDRVDAVIIEMRDAERTLLGVREATAAAAVTTTFLLLPLGVFLCLTLLFLAFFFLNTDVGERTSADAARGASELRYRRLFETAKDGILILDAGTGMVVDVNPFLIELLGYSHAQFLGKAVWELGFFKDIVANEEKFAELREKEYVRYENLPLETIHGIKIEVEFVSNVYLVAGRKVIQCNVRDQTERVRSERAQRESESRYRTLFEYAPDGIVLADAEGNYTDANAAMCLMLRYSRDELVRLHSSDIVVPEEAGHIDPALAAIRAGTPYHREWKFRRKDSSVFTAEVIATRMPDGNPMAMIRDITERKQAEAKLDDVNAEAAHILETMSDAFVTWDRNWLYTSINVAAERTLGFRREELLGRNVLDLFHPEPDDPLRVLYERSMAERIPVTLETFYPLLQIWVEVRAYPSPDGGLSVFFRDVTERAQHQIALRASQARLKEAQRIGRIGDWEFDLITESITWSPQVFEIFGRDPRRGPPRGIDEATTLYDAESAARLRERIARAIESGEAQDYQLVVLQPNGARGHVQARAVPVKDASGRVVSLHGTVQDISDVKQAEERIQSLNAELEERVAQRTSQLEAANEELAAFSTTVAKDLRVAEAADKMKSAFLATMSHELRTPLNSIIGFTGIVLQGLPGPLNPEQTRQLGMVRASAHHLLGLINDVLDLSKIEAGGMDLHMEPFDLRASIEQAVAQVRPLADKKGLSLHFGNACIVAPLVSDRRRVVQILLNLLSNAVKFTERGGITVTLEPASGHCALSGSPLQIRIADTGIGIKVADLPLLFQPFRQIDSSRTRRHDGTGLGLAICRRLANMLGGDVHVESELGKGSVFTVVLPISQIASAA